MRLWLRAAGAGKQYAPAAGVVVRPSTSPKRLRDAYVYSIGRRDFKSRHSRLMS
jgi:hypothetical protein